MKSSFEPTNIISEETFSSFSCGNIVGSALVLTAAGLSSRMSSDVKKQFMIIKNRPVIEITLCNLLSTGLFKQVVVTLPESDFSEKEEELYKIVSSFSPNLNFKCVKGADTRQASVYKGLCALSNENKEDIVVIHDAVRPFVSNYDLVRVMNAASTHEAATLGVRLKDSIKKVDWVTSQVKESLDRSEYCLVQTPQAFNIDIVMSAHKKAICDGYEGSDDASLVERTGKSVFLVEGSYDNIKLTTKSDIELAQYIYDKMISESGSTS